ncbi:cytochrome ubiquinol oxidase subunit I [Kineosporia sp. NBRC 101731]|uniref:cytochrome ubiquinol oxidase subunit I n=1 Tax=Kineosporia sp. NBRC 101731 TaxID=3032199 RepID=UPI0024A104CF|nr:cytochrome ubiquinol oxidase subunit I [Kineosporia sp. NBRC 101731]GLY31753.1 cytochrome ubiquinol oxidase subunit I [Kineosporia sp. NBRC 101731]
MDVTDLARLQFAVTTVYHYLFVPLSMSLSLLTAGFHTAWLRTRRDDLKRVTVLCGQLLLITFAVGVVTGLVQEFQFGLAWSSFARFYGDVFGPTLAIEGMLAFFLEATFLGLWFFGWDRLPKGLHLATIWVVAIGTQLSAFIILSANSFMQNPIGYSINEQTGRAELNDFSSLLFNKLNLAAYPHAASGALMTGGALLLAISLWNQLRRPGVDRAAVRVLGRVGAWVVVVGGALVSISGDRLGVVISEVQPMKMAAAEALYTTTTGAPFSLFSYAGPGETEPSVKIDIPGLLSFLVTHDFHGTVQGINDLQAQYTQQFGEANYVPWVPVAFWSFRLMIGVGMTAAALAALYLFVTRQDRDLPAFLSNPRLRPVVVLVPAVIGLMPLAANAIGWIFTETARQPWLAFGLFRTEQGVSPGVTAAEVIISIVGFTIVYGILAVVWVRLMCRLVRSGPGSGETEHHAPAVSSDGDGDHTETATDHDDARLVLTY